MLSSARCVSSCAIYSARICGARVALASTRAGRVAGRFASCRPRISPASTGPSRCVCLPDAGSAALARPSPARAHCTITIDADGFARTKSTARFTSRSVRRCCRQLGLTAPGACRHGDRCSRKHIRPQYSQACRGSSVFTLTMPDDRPAEPVGEPGARARPEHGQHDGRPAAKGV